MSDKITIYTLPNGSEPLKVIRKHINVPISSCSLFWHFVLCNGENILKNNEKGMKKTLTCEIVDFIPY